MKRYREKKRARKETGVVKIRYREKKKERCHKSATAKRMGPDQSGGVVIKRSAEGSAKRELLLRNWDGTLVVTTAVAPRLRRLQGGTKPASRGADQYSSSPR